DHDFHSARVLGVVGRERLTGVFDGAPVSDLVGGRISHYRIVSLLGKGGMGAVYRAHDERLGRDLALKVLLAEGMADETARTRLIREAQTASSLNHPHIAHVYEVGEDEGRRFIAMELV